MTAFSIILLVLIVSAAIISIWSQVKPAPNILWIAVLLLAIAMAVTVGTDHVR